MLSPEKLVREFDDDVSLFYDLMPHKIREILLISSPYDAFVLEQDGSLPRRIINEYHGLNLSAPPRLRRASSLDEALEMLGRRSFDLILTMPFVGAMDAFALSCRIKESHPDMPVVLLAGHTAQVCNCQRSIKSCDIDHLYIWSGDAGLLFALIKNLEDKANAGPDTAKAGVRVIILVEDSPDYISTFLPILYNAVVRQTQEVLDEGLNEEHRLLKMRARPKILTAASYEAAVALYERYRPFVFAVISDTRFPRGGHLDDEAGCRFLRKVRAARPDMALLLMSSEPANCRAAATVPAAFLDKNHDDLAGEMEQFLVNNLGFGPFVFRLPDGSEVGRAAGFNEFERCLRDIPAASLLYHARRNHFSTWFMARSEIGLALRLGAMKAADFAGEAEMRHYLSIMIHAFRKWRQFGVVSAFEPLDFEPQINDFVKIGQGSMGGKATGIAFWAALSRRHRHLLADFKGKITIPQTCVIGDDGFKDFVGRNKLFYLSGGENDIISQRFLAAPLPGWLRDALIAYLKKVTWPLTVRSSSIMEDAKYRPYAGLYRTCMLANNEPDFDTRLARLIQAVKLVYASTYFSGPRKFSRLTGQSRQDTMPVIIQQVAGRDYGGWFYPAISGVAQSYNYYPVSHMRPEDGVVSVALGLGHTVVEGGSCLRFSPAWPRILPQFTSVDDTLQNSQRQAYVLDLKSSMPRQDGQLVDLVRKISLSQLDSVHSPLPLLTSVYLRDEHRIRDSAGPGARVLTFAPILKYNSYPLAGIIQQMLNLGSEGMGCPVEVEFAVDLGESGLEPVFYLLQIRPMAVGRAAQEVEISPAERQAAFCRSQSSLGHGVLRVRDLVLVDQDSFEASKTRNIAKDISRLNSLLAGQKLPYLLIGPGRWGSADSRMGIPVRWEDISGAGAIVELTGGRLRLDPSQGTHFFHNITSLGIPYLTVSLRDGSLDRLDQEWLTRQGGSREGLVRHISFTEPIVIKVDGASGEGIAVHSTKERKWIK